MYHNSHNSYNIIIRNMHVIEEKGNEIMSLIQKVKDATTRPVEKYGNEVKSRQR